MVKISALDHRENPHGHLIAVCARTQSSTRACGVRAPRVGHESDDAEMVKLAKDIDEPCDIDQPTAGIPLDGVAPQERAGYTQRQAPAAQVEQEAPRSVP